jgi:membrane associated rhomboid family serine protease
MSRYPVTIGLIILNTLAFAFLAWQQKSLTMSTPEDVIAILNSGANLNVFTLDGQPWRIVTCMFLHFGVFHLAVNMYGLYGLGTYLEPHIGWLRFLLIYFICGIAASITSLYFNSFVISAGASGAIFGIYGYQLGAELISTYHDWEKLKKVLINFVVFAAVNTLIAGTGGIDTSAHIGGAVTGLVIALMQFKFRVLISATSLALVMILLPFTMLAVPKHDLEYYKIFQRVVAQEKAINSLLTQKQDAALRDSLNEVSAEWKQLYFDLKHIKRVPKTVEDDTATLARYIALRSDEAEFRIAVLEQSYIYLDSLEWLRPQFDSLPKFKHVLNYTKPELGDEPDSDSAREQPIAQPLETVRVFFDKDWREIEDDADAVYYRIGTRDSLGLWQGPLRDYYRNGDVQMKGAYVDGLRDGVFIYYSDHNTYTSAGRYDRERPEGKWENFHWNGKKQSEVYYDNRTFTSMMWDSLGNVQVVNGRGDYKSWYPNGVLKEQGSYYNGARTGDFLGYYSDGKPYYREYYENNRLVKGVSLGKDGQQYVYDELSELPTPVSGMKKYRDYIESNKRTPLNNREQGLVKVIFSVGVDGALWDFLILEGVSAFCDREAIRLIREGEPWRPALLHGQEKIQSTGYVEVRF